MVGWELNYFIILEVNPVEDSFHILPPHSVQTDEVVHEPIINRQQLMRCVA
jgi:hypothetical protein